MCVCVRACVCCVGGEEAGGRGAAGAGGGVRRREVLGRVGERRRMWGWDGSRYLEGECACMAHDDGGVHTHAAACARTRHGEARSALNVYANAEVCMFACARALVCGCLRAWERAHTQSRTHTDAKAPSDHSRTPRRTAPTHMHARIRVCACVCVCVFARACV